MSIKDEMAVETQHPVKANRKPMSPHQPRLELHPWGRDLERHEAEKAYVLAGPIPEHLTHG